MPLDRGDTEEAEAAIARIALVPDLIAARAAERPDALALTSAAGVLTYGALDAQANRLAHHLRSLGVDVGVPVGLCVPRSLEMVVGALGVLKAGGAYIPMDPAYPADRLAFMLDDVQAPAVITTASLAQALPLGRRTLVTVESPQVMAQPASAPLVDTEESDLAYIVYTSGSTGTPKGVEITHRGLTNLVAWHVHAFSVSDRRPSQPRLGPRLRRDRMGVVAVPHRRGERVAGRRAHPQFSGVAPRVAALREDHNWLRPDATRRTATRLKRSVAAHDGATHHAHRRRHAQYLPAGRSSIPARQQLRTERVHCRRHVRRGPPNAVSECAAVHRTGYCEYAHPSLGRAPALGITRDPRRDLYRRAGCRAWLQ